MQEAKHVIVFTGAGINTFSGILFYCIILLDTTQKSGVGSQNSNKKAQDILQRCIGKCVLGVPFLPTVRELGQVQWSLKMSQKCVLNSFFGPQFYWTLLRRVVQEARIVIKRPKTFYRGVQANVRLKCLFSPLYANLDRFSGHLKWLKWVKYGF